MQRFPSALVCLASLSAAAAACGDSGNGSSAQPGPDSGSIFDSGGSANDGATQGDTGRGDTGLADTGLAETAQGDTGQSDGGSGGDGASEAEASGDAGGTPPGTYAFVGGETLSIVNATDPTNLVVAGQYAGTFAPEANATTGVNATNGIYTYAVAQLPSDGGELFEFQVFDTSTVSSVKLVGSAPLDTAPGQVALLEDPILLSGNYAYVSTDGELEVFDVSNPTAPVKAGQLATDRWPRAMVLHDHYVLMAVDRGNHLGGAFVIADVSAPTSPTLVSSTDTNTADLGPWGIAVDGTHTYVMVPSPPPDLDAGLQSALFIYDTSNPQSPALVSSLLVPGGHSIATAGGYVFIAGVAPASGFLVVDVHDPQNPALVSTVSAHYATEGIALSSDGTRAYVTGQKPYFPYVGQGTLEVYDVSTPTAPVNLGYYATLTGGPYSALSIHVVP